MTPKSGQQITLSYGDQVATIAAVGAALREHTVDGRHVVLPFGADEIPPAFHGKVLAPWPNRLRDGAYTFAGRELQVPLSEPDRGTALHGLASWQRWEVDSVSPSSVTLALDMPASPGYPFQLSLTVTYALASNGLTVTTVARNAGAEPLPYGVGFHPWFSPGDGELDDCSLELGAASRVTVDERLLPTDTIPVADAYDLRESRSLAGVAFDDAWINVLPEDDGNSWSRLTAPDGAVTEIWADAEVQAWQVCTGDHVPGVRRAGIAIEPMTCIADAFRTGDRLLVLEPGTSHTLSWGTRLTK